MSFDWRTGSKQEMEAHFNPRAATPDPDAHVARFVARSRAARDTMQGDYDLRYGARPKETLDLHRPARGAGRAPLVMFIHGGYWRALDKSDHAFVVPALTASGAVVANVNYDLCPQVTLDDIVDEIANALVFCHAHAGEWGAHADAIYLLGHSAGAHLAASMLVHERDDLPLAAIRGVAALTGVYEPQVILSVSVNDEAQISAEVASRHDCLARTPRVDAGARAKMLVAAGGDEPSGWIAQSAAYATLCRDASLPTTLMQIPAANHFTVLERATERGEYLYEEVVALWR